jgi:glyoxylase-like metal-dependent hydrolase (beta-lactamase superfamily II)
MNIKRIINSVFASNTYILLNDNINNCWLVDIGDVQPVLDSLSKETVVKGIFLTHTHYDHLYGINKMVEIFPDCVVYTSKHGEEGLFSEKLNFSRYHDDPVSFLGSHIQILREGDVVELAVGYKLHVLETPGHDWSCLTYYMKNAIFTGDSYIPGLSVVTSFPRSNKHDAEISEQKILSYAKGRNLYPGHGPESIT